jgi:exopolysaccharide biosynthesis polyprenyl glycosylphosphotransferase
MGPRPDPAVAAVSAACRVLAAAAAYGAAWLLRFGVLDAVVEVRGRTDVLPARYLEALPVAVLAVLVAARAAGLRHAPPPGAPAPAAREFVAAAALATLLLAALALFTRDLFQYSRGFLLVNGLLLAPSLAAGEAAARALAAARRPREEAVLLVGGAEECASLARGLAAAPGARVRVAGRAGPAGDAPGSPPLLGPAADAARLAASAGARRVIVVGGAIAAAEAEAILRALADGTADVGLARRMPSPPGFPRPDLAAAGEFAVASYWESPLRGGGAAVKRAVDLVLAAALLLLLSPILILVAVLVRATSRGPVLFRQERVGLDGRVFRMLKFRTMRAGAEEGTGPVFAGPRDPRRTPAGGLLRRLSLDELPQLWNVIRGDMSLVGPRPERPEFVERFRREHPGYMLRHSLRAGVTGWAQVHGLRGRSSIEERLAYDLDYARRWSALLDLEILVRTVGQVIAGRNAY